MADTNFSQQILEKIRSTVSATAVIVMRVNDPAIKITAGALSPTGFSDLGEALARYWPASLPRHVIRYAGLSIDDHFQTLFVKRLPDGEHWLGLLFPHSTPLRGMRQEIVGFIESLMAKVRLESNPGHRLECILQHTVQPTLGSHQENPSGQGREGWIRINDLIEEAEDTKVPEKMFHTQEISAEDAYQASQTLNSTNTIVEDVADLHSHGEACLDIDVVKDEVSWQINDNQRSLAGSKSQIEKIRSKDQESLPEVESPLQEGQNDTWQVLKETSQHREDLVSIFQEDLELRDASAGLNEWSISPGPAEEKTAPEPVSGLDHMTSLPIVVDIASDKEVVSDITFCLVPRLDEHFLLGKLAENLRSWLHTICDQYSWQLDSLSVRPKYLKWTLSDFPESLISEMFQIIRKKTSERVFRIYPELQKENSSDDFWSPGFLVNSQEGQVAI